MRSSHTFVLCAAMLMAVPSGTFAADRTAGAVEQTGGNMVPQTLKLPPLKLTSAQREHVRRILLTKHAEVEFRLKAAKSAKDFIPQVGAKLPTGVKPDGLPSELTQDIPQLADYGYAKMKDQILLVNEMSDKIAEIIPEKQPQTTGQK
jgi:hypothetical protein